METIVTNIINHKIAISNIQLKDLNLEKTFECGQCFRWSKMDVTREPINWHNTVYNFCSYKGVVNSKIIFLEAYTDDLGNEIILTNCTKSNIKYILKYLNLDRDYDEEIQRLNLDEGDYAYKAYKSEQGIRILKQELDETMISFIISQQNNIPRIKSIIKNMCEQFGSQINTVWYGEVFADYAFPTVNQLTENTDNLYTLKLGYREAYIRKLIPSLEGWEKFNSSFNMDTDSLIKVLQHIDGVGPKVANCIALFSFNRLDSFPRDTWIKKIENSYYNGNLDESKYGSIKGLIQQYMFSYERNKYH